MRIVIELLFPKRLARLSYFVRTLLCNGLLFFLHQDVSSGTPIEILAVILTLLYAALFVILPRIRDTGMGAGWIVLAFIPLLSTFLGIALLFRRSNYLQNPLQQPLAGVSSPSTPLRSDAEA
ncbi:MAG: hypothetical protein ABJF10_29140 [Chthoniobacter sp.]|uniref:hypothetical protein n=1 Tax=Chthoniobacter sp. TaxID=2510640 RepID=UPI0032A5C39D